MKLDNIDYHIWDSCNLNCVSCNHFAPLCVEPNQITLEQARMDFESLKRFECRFNKLTILGGEACLNPDLVDIIRLAVEYFPGKVKLITNGTIVAPLYELKQAGLDTVIELVITEYPFMKDFRTYYDNLKSQFPDAIFYTFRHEHGFIADHLSYQPTGASNNLLLHCEKRFKCVQFIAGKLYICHYAGFLDSLNSITNPGFTNKDACIDWDCNEEQFNEFFETHIPEICRHCKFVLLPYEQLNKKPWSKSKKDPNEWID